MNAVTYMPVKKKKSAAVSYDKHAVDKWGTYICDHITENISAEQIAEKFGYSVRHFKRVFSQNYEMPVTDYIRKCRLDILAEELRKGKAYKSIAELYGFFSSKGFTAAFIRYFGVSPREYSKDQFDVIDLGEWREKNMDRINIQITTINEIKLLAHPEIGVRGADVDIPAQMQYWLDKDYPSKNRRMADNTLKKDDKIAMWYHPEDICLVDYVIGPVVEDFPDEMDENDIPITIKGGKYAIFHTNSQFDTDVEMTLRLFSRCLFYGWMIEHKEEIDWFKFTFERYVGKKIWCYNDNGRSLYGSCFCMIRPEI